ncbi:HAD-superfamily hydrolase [Tuber magnatum]|uniref:HAD-superfamily hydrolase n=1 Tax=Tuber magnatum TaxID=42249 RepID=A0A317T2F2_9PEZI|nr:HAD-superfamily hydrolase [Tuber magnatum]
MSFSLLSRRVCTRRLPLTRTVATSLPPRVFPPGHFGFALDIDGVLLRGPKPHPSAKKALSKLQENGIPFVLLTNGGGLSEAARCEELSLKLDFPITPSQLVQSHTPAKDFAKTHKTILVVGGEGENCRKIAEEYGFENVFIPEDFYATDPNISPFNPSPPPAYARNVPKGTKIDAIFVFNGPRDWALSAQLIADLIRSDNGVYGTLAEPGSKMHLPTFFTNSDLVWASQYHIPRLGQGAFKLAVGSIVQQYSKALNRIHLQTIGKPTHHAFRYAQQLLIQDLIAKLGETSPELELNEVTHGLAPADASADATAAEEAIPSPPVDLSPGATSEEATPSPPVDLSPGATSEEAAPPPPPVDPIPGATEEEKSSQSTEAKTAATPDATSKPPFKPYKKQSAILKRVYMIGDNPESDIQGANQASYRGTTWWSLLVRSGVWSEPQDTKSPIAVVDDVLAAVDWAMENEQKIKDAVALGEYPRSASYPPKPWKKAKFSRFKRFTPGSNGAKTGEVEGGGSGDVERKVDHAMKEVKDDDALGKKKADGEGGSDSV